MHKFQKSLTVQDSHLTKTSKPDAGEGQELSKNPSPVSGELIDIAHDPEAGATTAEYGIVMLAAVGFAGLLVVILKSEEVRSLLMGIVENALSTGM